MKNVMLTLILIAAVVVLSACDNEALVSSEQIEGKQQTGEEHQNIDELIAHIKQEAALAGKRTIVDFARAQTFDPAGPYGGGVLVPGTSFPPDRSFSVLLRGKDKVRILSVTTGLPPGAYTTWWLFFNEPGECLSPIEGFGSRCGFEDFFNEAAAPSAFWSDGAVVKENGIGFFHANVGVGELPDNPDQIALPGPGLLNPKGAELWYIIKFHGPASDDPDVLYEQTHTLLGSCEEGANAYDFGPPFGVQCFDPQVVIH